MPSITENGTVHSFISMYKAGVFLAITSANPMIFQSPSKKRNSPAHSNKLEKDKSSFYLDDRAQLETSSSIPDNSVPRWQAITHYIDKRTSLVLISGESVKINHRICISESSILFLRYGAALPSISTDGLVMELAFTEDTRNSEKIIIASLTVTGGKQPSVWKSIEIDFSWLANKTGYLSLSCHPGPKNDPTADWLAITDLCISPSNQLSLCKVKSFESLRVKNEINHFSQVYKHEMYAETQDRQAEEAKGESRKIRKLSDQLIREEIENTIDLEHLEPVPRESPHSYAMRLLALHIPQNAPDFQQRLNQRSANGKTVKILSLCCGAARIEAEFAAQSGTNVEWSLLDLNSELLNTAAIQFSPNTKLDLIEANANELVPTGEKWDVILCISALHHIVELEGLVKFCFQSLNPDGEFWSIGENVGRNGNRLWQGAKEKSNKLFKTLPEKYRFNHHSKTCDDNIPDNDYSVGCFEGIRSQDIEDVLNRWFYPVDVLKRNCFLWRTINLAYSDNYDLRKKEDRQWIQHLVKHELMHFQSGGRGTELFGVYSPRKLKF